MAVLRLLAECQGEIVSADEILATVWHGRVVSGDSVSTAIYQLRQLLGDDSQRSTYIRTEARRGYRLIAPVREIPVSHRRIAIQRFAVMVAGLAVVGVAWSVMEQRPQSSALLLVEQTRDQTQDESSQPLHLAIEASLLGELVSQLPGRVVLESSPVPPAYTLQSAIVACDLGPTLLVRLVDNADNSFLWSQAYRIEDWAGEQAQPSLVHVVANDIGGYIRAELAN